MNETNQSRVVVLIHTVVAVVMGWFCVYLNNDWMAGPLGIIVLIIIGFASARMVGKKGVKWWLGNGAIIYLFVWLTMWIYFFNLVI